MGKSQETELLETKRMSNFLYFFLFPVNKNYIHLD